MRIEEAAKLLSIGRTKMYDLMRQGVIPKVHIGSAVRVLTEDVRDFAQAQRAEAYAMLTSPGHKALGTTQDGQ